MNNVSIQSIETVYRGIRFRSRLEARWAVFFDSLGICWQYEMEGYRSGSVYYLPDFKTDDILGAASSFFEVKPKWPGREEWEKIEMVSANVLIGNPFMVGDDYLPSSFDYLVWSMNGDGGYCPNVFAVCRYCEKSIELLPSYMVDASFVSDNPYSESEIKCSWGQGYGYCHCDGADKWPYCFHRRLLDASRAAKSIRFW